MTAESDRKRARRRLLHALGAAGVASSLASQWTRPVTRSVVLPTHADTTPPPAADPGWVWLYDNTAPITPGSEPADPNAFASGTGPCGTLSGPWIPTQPFAQVFIGAGTLCEGEYRITSWIVDGVNIVVAPLNVDAPEPDSCRNLLDSMAAAMNSVDPVGNWQRRDDGVVPADGGCAQHVFSGGNTGAVVYGAMTIEDRTDASRVWTVWPVIEA